jgi:hypothetical protein
LPDSTLSNSISPSQCGQRISTMDILNTNME